jgi:carbonic anhydrase/acetyltransferase-like protein (isoleucine patch superfamily)
LYFAAAAVVGAVVAAGAFVASGALVTAGAEVGAVVGAAVGAGGLVASGALVGGTGVAVGAGAHAARTMESTAKMAIRRSAHLRAWMLHFIVLSSSSLDRAVNNVAHTW